MKTPFLTHLRLVALVLAASLGWVRSGNASPLCMPPGPADAGVLRAAPEECLFYLGWNGAGKADAKSENQTEQLLAEEEVQAFISQIDSQLTALVQQAMRGNPAAAAFADDLPALVKGVLTRPAAIYVSKVAFGPMGPDVQAGLLVNTGDMQPVFAKAVAQLEAMALAQLPPGMKIEELDVSGAKLHRAPSPPGAPTVVWGFKDSYFLISVGADAGQELVKRITTGSPPGWLAKAQDQAAIDRVGSTWYVNLAGILQTARPFMTDPKISTTLDALGIPEISHLSCVSGFDRTGMASKTFVATGAKPKGIFAVLAGKPLAAADVQLVPKEASFAVALRLDAANALKQILDIVGGIEPAARAQADGALEQVDSQLGIKLVDDLLAALGDVWCVYGVDPKPAPGKEPPKLGNIAVTVTVRDRKRFEKGYQTLIKLLKQQAQQSEGAWTVKESKYRDQQVYYVPLKASGAAPAGPLPFNFDAATSGLTPCWCLTDERLTICSNPQALKDFLARGKSAPSLASQSEWAAGFKGKAGPVMLSYSDTAASLRSAYPGIQAALPLAAAGLASSGINFQIPTLPSLAALERHARPAVSFFKQTPDGFLAESYQTVPIVNSQSLATTGVGAALLLPAVQAGRTAARRTQSSNNMKQIGLALHNFLDATKGFPASASYDAEGKPMLSWRVYMLPYLGELELYNSFHLNEPWDSEHNKTLIARMPAVFKNPNLADLEPGKTVYLAAVGEKGAIQPKQGTAISEITDGTSNTIMGIEASADRAVIWTKPGDWSPDANDPKAGLYRHVGDIFLMLYADGSVRPVNAAIDVETFKALLTRNGGEAIKPDGN